jgi:hypothetical protein
MAVADACSSVPRLLKNDPAPGPGSSWLLKEVLIQVPGRAVLEIRTSSSFPFQISFVHPSL